VNLIERNNPIEKKQMNSLIVYHIFYPYGTGQPFDASIEQSQHAHQCSLTRLYIVG
jgi:hypothetical protein